MRILLVEDEKHDYRVVKRTLDKSDLACEIVWAQRGEEALAHLQAETVDIILLDFNLPGISGLATFEQIISQGINVPVVFVTGSNNVSTAVEALKLGAQDYLVKDPHGEYLKLLPTVVRKAYSRWQDSQARRRAETALLRSEENLAKAQKITHLGSWRLDLETGEMEWSDEMYRIYGVDKEFDTSLENRIKLVHPDDRAMLKENLAEAKTKGKAPSVEYRAVLLDGTEKIILLYLLVYAQEGQTYTTTPGVRISAKKKLKV